MNKAAYLKSMIETVWNGQNEDTNFICLYAVTTCSASPISNHDMIESYFIYFYCHYKNVK
jgi:hypothetical protein